MYFCFCLIHPAGAVLQVEDDGDIIFFDGGIFKERIGHIANAPSLTLFYSVQKVHILFLNFKEFRA